MCVCFSLELDAERRSILNSKAGKFIDSCNKQMYAQSKPHTSNVNTGASWAQDDAIYMLFLSRRSTLLLVFLKAKNNHFIFNAHLVAYMCIEITEMSRELIHHEDC